MKRYLYIAAALFSLILLAGCEHTSIPSLNQTSDDKVAEDEQPAAEHINLVIWSYYELDWVVSQFQDLHPNVTVEVKVHNYDDYAGHYIDAIVEGDVPDIMVVHTPHFGGFTGITGLENLSETPYLAPEHQNAFDETLWNSMYSVDRKRLLGLPVNTAPLLTFYRADILQEYGFPVDPSELGNYMEEPEHWFDIARALRKDDKWINQWTTDVIHLFGSTLGMFDQELHFLRSSPVFAKGIDIAKQIRNESLSANVGIWGEVGQEALRSGKIAMVYLGPWGANQLKAWAPETAGKWRATRLPFNLHGWDGSAVYSIPSEGTQKEMAWKFIEFATTTSMMVSGHYDVIPAYLPARDRAEDLTRSNDFLGGQKLYALVSELIKNVDANYTLTPLDNESAEIWFNVIQLGLEKNQPTEEIIAKINNQIEAELGKELDFLRQTID
jgi:multiple sugar transport system substrate-binding protein